MKFVALIIATGLALASAQIIPPPVPPVFGLGGPFFPGMMMGGLGLGLMGGLGPLGLMGGLGPLGLMGGLGMGSFGPLGGLIGGRAHFGGVRGRRSVEEVHGSPTTHQEINCTVSMTLVKCVGQHEIIECALESHVPSIFENMRVKFTDLTFQEKVANDVQMIKLLPRRLLHRLGHSANNHLSLYENESLVKTEPGFRVKDPVCFSELFTLVKAIPDKFHVTLE